MTGVHPAGDPPSASGAAGRARFFFGIVWKIALLLLLIAAASRVSEWATGQLTAYLTPSTEPAVHRAIMIATALYVVLMTLPFVPGVEIGISMMVMFGSGIAPLVYFGTLLALVTAFGIGRLVPQRLVLRLLESLRLRRAAGLVMRIESLDPGERLEFLLQNASRKCVPFLLRHRFLALFLALNLPGNAIVGGGGGICLVVGFTRLFTVAEFLLTVAIAVSPVPLVVYFTGY